MGLVAIVCIAQVPCAAQGNLNPPLSSSPPPMSAAPRFAEPTLDPTKAVDSQGAAARQSILRSRAPELSSKLPSEKGSAATFNGSPGLDRILTQIVLDNMPHQYTDEKKWGSQKKRWDGIRLRRDDDGGKLETERKYKMVNHGTWKKYSASLIDPNQEFTAELKNMSSLPSGATRFDLEFSAHLKLDARQSKWVNGLQLYSFNADGHARIRLRIACEMQVTMDISRFPPDLIFAPTVTDADIVVDEFRLDRISKAGGEFAQQATRSARKILDEKIEEKETKLVKKLNENLDKHKDDLRISIADAIKSKWYEKTRDFLPDAIQNSIGSGSRK